MRRTTLSLHIVKSSCNHARRRSKLKRLKNLSSRTNLDRSSNKSTFYLSTLVTASFFPAEVEAEKEFRDLNKFCSKFVFFLSIIFINVLGVECVKGPSPPLFKKRLGKSVVTKPTIGRSCYP